MSAVRCGGFGRIPLVGGQDWQRSLSPRHQERFWSLVDPDGPVADVRPEMGLCWRWRGRSSASGYPVFDYGAVSTHAYRVAWGLANGEQPPKGLPFEHFACSRAWCANGMHVRPVVARGDSGQRWRWLAGWNARHRYCVSGHRFSKANSLVVAGGRACRQCRREEEQRSRKPKGGD
jgi:hypothetical protein